MTITHYEQTQLDHVVEVRVTSDLVGLVYYHWYLDGLYLGPTTSPTHSFYLNDGEQSRVDVVDTLDADHDAYADPPDRFPARRLVWWVRSLDSDIVAYRVDERRAGSEWTVVATLHHDPGRWSYQAVTERLDDLTDYEFRVVPIDAAGNDGTPSLVDTQRIVRTPDAPDWDLDYDSGPRQVTISEAA